MPVFRSTTYGDKFQNEGSSPSPYFGLDRQGADREIIVNWNGLFQAAQDFLPSASVAVGPGGQKYIARQTPHLLSFKDNLGKLYSYLYAETVTSVRQAGFSESEAFVTGLAVDPTTQMPTTYAAAAMGLRYSARLYNVFTDAQVTAFAGPLNGFPDEGGAFESLVAPVAVNGISRQGTRWITKKQHPTGRIVTLKGNLAEVDYSAGKKPITEGIGVVRPEIGLEYTWWNIPLGAYPQKAIIAALGRVNKVTFDGWPPETVLFDAVEPRPEIDPFGNQILTLVYRFRVLPNVDRNGTARGHNYVLVNNGGVADYRLVTLPGNDPETGQAMRPFRVASLSALFRPDQT